jgi:hypothetical protein
MWLEWWGIKRAKQGVAGTPVLLRTGERRRILSERYFTDHFGKLPESAKIVVCSAVSARLTEKS